jgi:hypothetical protein
MESVRSLTVHFGNTDTELTSAVLCIIVSPQAGREVENIVAGIKLGVPLSTCISYSAELSGMGFVLEFTISASCCLLSERFKFLESFLRIGLPTLSVRDTIPTAM